MSDLLKPLKFCVFDLETTGGNLKNDRIIEIGMVQIDELEITGKKSFLVDPKRQIPDFIQRLTSIKQKDVKGQKTIEELIDEILEFIGDRILIAHNASFDVPFLNAVLKRLGREELENRSICTNLMTKYLIPTLMNSNLNYMSKIFDISHNNAHRALDDADATAKLFLKYIDIFQDKGIQKINHLYYPKNRFELDLTHFKKSKDGPEDIEKKIKKIQCPYVMTFKGPQGVILYAYAASSTSRAEQDFLISKVKELDWRNISVRLAGPYTEALIKLDLVLSKIPKIAQDEIVEKIKEFNIPETPLEKAGELKSRVDHINQSDFIILNHLVPGQYIIYPIAAMGRKSGLIFRFPGHKKKLIQYLNSKSNRMQNGKFKKQVVSSALKEVFDVHVANCLLQDKEVFLFKRHNNFNDNENFFKNLDIYLSKNKNSYNYPKKYI